LVLPYVKLNYKLFMIEPMAEGAETKRGYDLRKRLENMDQTRRAVLQAARRQLEVQGYRQVTMASLAAESGVTRQTIHNLFGSKRGILEALFDTLALEGGMERMREVMTHTQPQAMLQGFVRVFCDFWKQNRVLFRRIHGIAAIDPEFGEIIAARNERRHAAAVRIAKRLKRGRDATDATAALAALTSFEFYDALTQFGRHDAEAEAIVFNLACAAMDV
jgi:AcrR family transcriptional regulator